MLNQILFYEVPLVQHSNDYLVNMRFIFGINFWTDVWLDFQERKERLHLFFVVFGPISENGVVLNKVKLDLACFFCEQF
jgi:hypothetical protein